MIFSGFPLEVSSLPTWMVGKAEGWIKLSVSSQHPRCRCTPPVIAYLDGGWISLSSAKGHPWPLSPATSFSVDAWFKFDQIWRLPWLRLFSLSPPMTLNLSLPVCSSLLPSLMFPALSIYDIQYMRYIYRIRDWDIRLYLNRIEIYTYLNPVRPLVLAGSVSCLWRSGADPSNAPGVAAPLCYGPCPMVCPLLFSGQLFS